MPDLSTTARSGSVVVPVALMVPLGPALLLSLSAISLAGHLDRGSTRFLAAARAVHLLAFSTPVVISTCVAAIAGGVSTETVLRNQLGYAGLTLLGVVAFGGQAGWATCFGPVLLLLPWTQRADGSWQWFGWYLAPSSSVASWLTAASIAVLGVVLYLYLGDRNCRRLG